MACVQGHLSFCFILSLVVGVICAASEDDVRLIDGYSNSNQGRVEVFHGDTWGTVCGQGWGSEEATVVCRQLGLGDVLLAKAFFGNGSGPILVGTHCHDHDFHITECHGSWEEVPTTCTHEDDVAVICYPENHEEATTGLSTWNNLIIAIALGVFCWLVYKIITFIEDSKVDDDEVSLHEVRTDDHPNVASKRVSISDECDASGTKDDVTSGNNGATSGKGEVTSGKNDATGSKNCATTKDTTKGFATTSKDDGDNYETDERHISTNKPNDIQTSDVSVQTMK